MEITFRVLEGFDKGRVFRCLSSPISIGREEGNSLQLNDERVSRFHAKIAQDRGDIVLMDLTSTNGTWVNGHPVKMRCLSPGDRIQLGKTTLLFGSSKQIREAFGPSKTASSKDPEEQDSNLLPLEKSPEEKGLGQTVLVNLVAKKDDGPEQPDSGIRRGEGKLEGGDYQSMPPIPTQLGPSQVARMAGIFDHLHKNLSEAISGTQSKEGNPDGLTLDFLATQKLLRVQMDLARYLLAFVDPTVRDDLEGE